MSQSASSVIPYFSVCIPQYGRTDFLLQALDSLAGQDFRDFEVCISDDCSPDGRHKEVLDFLQTHALPNTVAVQARNVRYDANLRAAMSLARGRYCLLLGNDDALANGRILERLHTLIESLGPCGAVIPDFEDYRTGARAQRIRATRNFGAGPEVAARHFRNFSFVSGIVLAREPAQALATSQWDGSEMYQTYIGCRMVAAGHALLEIAEPLVRKDIHIPGESVDSYARRPRLHPCPVVERPIPLVQLGRLVADAIAPHASVAVHRRLNATILRQLVCFTYPFWLLEYRRVQSWRYAAGIALAMRPQRIAQGMELSRFGRVSVSVLYALMTTAGLLAPWSFFARLQPWLYRLAKWVRRPAQET